MGMRDEMFRAKVLIFMIPLVLPIGQPPAHGIDDDLAVVECAPLDGHASSVVIPTPDTPE